MATIVTRLLPFWEARNVKKGVEEAGMMNSVETTSDHFGESKARFRNTEGTHLFTADERAPSY